MYWRNNNGGWNKRCGTVEKTLRIDSFDSAIPEGGGSLFVCADGKTKLLDFIRYTIYGPEDEREVVDLWAGDWSQTVELSHKANGYGGEQIFFLCPGCGARVRHLYCKGWQFVCRKCAKLNYRSQQETRSGSMYFYDKGMVLVEKHLDRWPRVRPDGFSFCDWVPERPRYMHQTTYRRYLRRFLRYRQQHEARELDDLRRILGPREWARLLQLQYED